MTKPNQDSLARALAGADRQALLRDIVRLVEREVESKTGMGGLAIKGAYRIGKAVRGDFTQATVETLLPDFIEALEVVAGEKGEGQSYEELFTSRSSDVAGALLSLTDEKVESSSNQALRRAYRKLRSTAVRHVADAAPGMGRLLDCHASG